MATEQQPAVPPVAALLQVLGGFWTARAIYVAAKLGLADLVHDSPKSPAELARLTGTHAASLRRLLRALSGVGWFQEDAEGRFAPTPLTQALRTGVPGSLRYFAMTELGEEHYPAWGDLLYGVKSGQLGFDHVFGMSLWEYWACHPDQADVFNRAMSEVTAVLEPAVLQAMDLSACTTLVDIGGGRGTLIASLLRAYPAARGIVLDLPHVVELGREFISAEALTDRCTMLSGDFFQGVPEGGDAYILKWVLHDWDDERSVAILETCRRAMSPESRLIVIEAVIPGRNEPSLHKFMDLNMFVMTGGRERTAEEYRALFERAGFDLTRTTVTPTETAVLVAVPKPTAS